jgi:hypothetical protein
MAFGICIEYGEHVMQCFQPTQEQSARLHQVLTPSFGGFIAPGDPVEVSDPQLDWQACAAHALAEFDAHQVIVILVANSASRSVYIREQADAF